MIRKSVHARPLPPCLHEFAFVVVSLLIGLPLSKSHIRLSPPCFDELSRRTQQGFEEHHHMTINGTISDISYLVQPAKIAHDLHEVLHFLLAMSRVLQLFSLA